MIDSIPERDGNIVEKGKKRLITSIIFPSPQ